MSKDKTTYELVVKKQRIEVSKEVYRAYYECREREKYLDKLHIKHAESLEALQEHGFSLECNSSLISKESAEDKAIRKIMVDEVKNKFVLLSHDEILVMQELFLNGLSERELARKLNVSQQLIHHRKNFAIKKIKKNFKKF